MNMMMIFICLVLKLFGVLSISHNTIKLCVSTLTTGKTIEENHIKLIMTLHPALTGIPMHLFLTIEMAVRWKKIVKCVMDGILNNNLTFYILFIIQYIINLLIFSLKN